MLEGWFDYDMWLLAVFDPPPSRWFAGGDEEHMLWQLSKQPELVVEWVTRTWQECAKLPELFTDEQIAEGLYYIVDPGKSDLGSIIFGADERVDLEAQRKCI